MYENKNEKGVHLPSIYAERMKQMKAIQRDNNYNKKEPLDYALDFLSIITGSTTTICTTISFIGYFKENPELFLNSISYGIPSGLLFFGLQLIRNINNLENKIVYNNSLHSHLQPKKRKKPYKNF